MSEPVLLVEKSEGIAVLTLNRPAAMNALSRELRAAIVSAFDDVAGDAAIRVVILTGAGRAFCAGLDLKELGGESAPGSAEAGANENAITGGDVVAAMGRVRQPIIGAVNGFAITGGFELALACDVLIGSTEARFADTHARVGIMPAWGLSQKLSRLIGIYRAKELSFTGNFLDAERACAWGLLNRVVPPADLLPVCRALARDMLSCDPEVLPAYKRVIDEGFALAFGDALGLEVREARARAGSFTSEKIAARRVVVQDRGRTQSGKR